MDQFFPVMHSISAHTSSPRSPSHWFFRSGSPPGSAFPCGLIAICCLFLFLFFLWIPFESFQKSPVMKREARSTPVSVVVVSPNRLFPPLFGCIPMVPSTFVGIVIVPIPPCSFPPGRIFSLSSEARNFKPPPNLHLPEPLPVSRSSYMPFC